jgi:hypothetical protein
MLIQIQRPPRTALLLQLDGTLPNLALTRISRFDRSLITS